MGLALITHGICAGEELNCSGIVNFVGNTDVKWAVFAAN